LSHVATSRWQEPSLSTKDAADLESSVAKIRSAQRVHIVGGPGSGKSTFAQHVSASSGLPVYSLDLIAYEGPDYKERSLAFRSAKAREIASTPRWITEGIFIGWTQPLLEEADLIIWLDYVSWRNAAARIAIRTFSGALQEMKVRRGSDRFLRIGDYRRNLEQLFTVLTTSREYWGPATGAARYPATREELEGTLHQYAGKVVHITQKRDAKTVIELLRSKAPPVDRSNSL
jgi:adenylate kinase family enzyme